MPNSAGTIERIAAELGEALAPLEEILGPQLFDRLGVTLPFALASNSAIQNKFTAAATSAKNLKPKIDALAAVITADNTAQIITASGALIAGLAELVARFKEAGDTINGAAAALPPADKNAVQALAAEMSVRVLEYVTVGYLHEKFPNLTSVMTLLGIVDKEHEPPRGLDISNVPRGLIPRRLYLNRLPDFMLDPVAYLNDLYEWGGPATQFQGEALFLKILVLLESFKIPGTIYNEPGGPLTLEAYFFNLEVGEAGGQANLDANLSLPGNIKFTRSTLFSDLWKGKTDIDAKFNAGVGATLTPPFDLKVTPPSGNFALTASLGLEAEYSSGDPINIISVTGGTRLQVQKIAGALGVRANFDTSGGSLTPTIVVDLSGGKLIIDFSQGDGFIQQLLSGLKFDADFNLGADWDPEGGFRFRGDAGIEILLPLHIDLSVLVIEGLYFQIGVSNEIPIQLGLATKFAANLGPLKAVVEQIGVNVNITFPSNGKGKLGIADIDFTFKPPKGVGLSLDTGVVRGGGYLYFDFDKEEYAGVLELSIAEIVTVKAIGLITTRLPGGASGFSLLIIIAAEFGSGIQLGFGFTLIGLGGLLGLNRTMLPEPIAAGIRSGGINSIMFPPNPVENAPKIISDLRTYFPPAAGRFLIGPMAKIGWGTPTLISLSIGVIIEIPGKIAIIGVLRVNLPAEDAPIIVINVGFIGALEYEKERLWFFASMFDSRILFLTLEGDIGLLMDWSENSNFVLSVGGFHPLFQPPPLPFPNPRRIRIDVLNNPLQRITVEGYFAVTSNTVQFGARAELYMGLAVVSISGHFAFDALFQFSPFKFIIQMSFSVSLNVFGIGLFSIHLKMSLEGPTPWRAKGTGKLTIDLWLFEISISANFDVTWGDARNTTLPSIQVVPLLKAEFEKDVNWRAALPAGNNLLVSLRQLEEGSEQLVLHPLGSLQIAQRAVPLNLKIDKIGNREASDGEKFGVAVSSPGLGVTDSKPQEKFAIAQYQDMSNDEKLTRPAFQRFEAGLELSITGRQLGSTKAVRRVVRYETIIIDSNFKRFVIKFFGLVGTLFTHFLSGAAVKQSKLSMAYKRSFVPFDADDRVQVKDMEYVVAGMADNKSIANGVAFANEAMARDFMNAHLAQNPGDKGEIHIVPAFEAAEL
jgi:hypothetical protein